MQVIAFLPHKQNAKDNKMKKYLSNPWFYLVLALLLGWFIGRQWQDEAPVPEREKETAAETTYTCSMHPQIRQDEPGDCPICGMELITVENKTSGADPSAIHLSETAKALANIQTMVVQKGRAQKTIPLTGQIKAAADAIHAQVTHIPGRLEALYVEYPGQQVRQGTIIARLYSPALIQAQTELQEAYSLRDAQPGLYAAAKNKLSNWTLSENDIAALLAAQTPMKNFPIRASASGVVRTLDVQEGDYLRAEQRLFSLIELEEVWAELNLHEQDLPWIDEGDSVQIKLRSYPAEVFTGQISYIDPVIDPITQVATARVVLPNQTGLLKPEMTIQAQVSAKLKAASHQIAVPKSAVLWTGSRSVIYLMNADGTYRLREVTLAGDLGHSYLIASGLEEGARIVVNGVFTVDAAAQLAGKPSMMSPQTESGEKASAGGQPHEHDSQEGKAALQEQQKQSLPTLPNKQGEPFAPLLSAYLDLTQALSEDQKEQAQEQARGLYQQAQQIIKLSLSGSAAQWQDFLKEELLPTLQSMQRTQELEQMRADFKKSSAFMVDLARALPGNQNLYVQYCPMADQNKGGFWLSTKEEIANPYFGAMMYRCGSVVDHL